VPITKRIRKIRSKTYLIPPRVAPSAPPNIYWGLNSNTRQPIHASIQPITTSGTHRPPAVWNPTHSNDRGEVSNHMHHIHLSIFRIPRPDGDSRSRSKSGVDPTTDRPNPSTGGTRHRYHSIHLNSGLRSSRSQSAPPRNYTLRLQHGDHTTPHHLQPTTKPLDHSSASTVCEPRARATTRLPHLYTTTSRPPAAYHHQPSIAAPSTPPSLHHHSTPLEPRRGLLAR
jgi:hypothetical protein